MMRFFSLTWPIFSNRKCSFINLLIYLCLLTIRADDATNENKCYDTSGKAKICTPGYINAAFNRPVIATNTCGSPPSKYCLVDDNNMCFTCDNNVRANSHPPEYLTDGNGTSTWWQSDTMLHGIQYPNSVNLTLSLGKSFNIIYVQIKFHSSRPESFVIYKRTNETSPWIPYQYYSRDCRLNYNLPPNQIITRDNETSALCTDESSDIVPLSGGSVAFSTLDSRPSAYNFENSDELKEWVTATDILITLNRMNTFGDEHFPGDESILSTYYYAISDISVGGICKCNGHAERCVSFQDKDFEEKYKCECEHNTAGNDCEKCAPFFNDRPWAPASYADANECLPCNCNGLSNKCIFNQTLYDFSGHGGYCIDCQRNTEGAHCEFCKFGFYRSEHDNECINCRCDKEGSVNLQCDPTGKCRCKPGVTGEKCDRCAPGFFDLTYEGCKPCQCNQIGSLDVPAVCDPKTGKCRCKQNVDGLNCDKCKLGFFNLDANIQTGCLSCFCYGHSSECQSSSNYISHEVRSDIHSDNLKEWTAIDSFGKNEFINADNQSGVYVQAANKELWFNAPAKYLGNQLFSYNQNFSFTLKFLFKQSKTYKKDIVIENAKQRLQIHRSIYDIIDTSSFDNQEPILKNFSFTLKESSGWIPTLLPKDFQKLLTNITSIRIKAVSGDYTVLSHFKLGSAQRASKSSFQKSGNVVLAPWVEQCNCTQSYTGQFCEKCQTGFKRERPNGDAFTRCVPCTCNNHSLTCDSESGQCNCIDNTKGENCELCVEGYYGNALIGTKSDCKKCPCPNDGPCAEILNFQTNIWEVVCLNCPTGTRGNLCDSCDDGYYEFESLENSILNCKKCECNSNLDENAVGNCDSITGQCLRCIYNTTGDSCEKCLPSYWGNALDYIKCHGCECDKLGSIGTDCDLDNGQCTCKKNVHGRTCNECEDTYWNLKSGEGCTECKCNPLGSLSLSCDQNSGKCQCHEGVTGDKCDQCLPNYFGFSETGCQNCSCNSFGSIRMQCDLFGKCQCRESVAGDKCDKCVENYHNFSIGCVPCDDCYNLVQSNVTILRKKIQDLDAGLDKIINDAHADEVEEINKALEAKLLLLKEQFNKLHQSFFDTEKMDLLKPSFEKSVKNLNLTIEALNYDYKKLQKPIDEFSVKLTQLLNMFYKFNNLTLQLEIVETSLLTSERDINETLEIYKDELSFLKSDINITLQQKLKSLAKDARQHSEIQKTMANDFSKSVNFNINQAKSDMHDLNKVIALSSAKKVTFAIEYQSMMKESAILKREAVETKKILQANLKSLESSVKDLASVSIDKVVADKEVKIIDFTSVIKNKTQEVENLKSKLLNDAADSENSFNEVKNKLNTIIIKNNDMKQLFDKSENTKNTTNDSFQIAYDAFEKANQINETLSNFDEIINSDKRRAEMAEKIKFEIDANIEESREFAEQMKKDFKSLKNNVVSVANETLNTLLVYENVEMNVNETQLKLVKNLANKTLGLSDRSKLISSKYSKTRPEVEVALNKHENMGTNLANLHANATKLNANATELLNKIHWVQEELSEVTSANITDFTLEGISKELIIALTEKFKEYDSKAVDEKLADLLKSQENLNEELKCYERQIPELKRNIVELTNIRDSIGLTEKCDHHKT